MSRTSTKKGLKPAKSEGPRFNISMDDETRERGEILAARDLRSLSNLIQVLINREYERHFPQPENGKVPK